MPEFLTLLPPDTARTLLISHLSRSDIAGEEIEVSSALGRVLAEDIPRLIHCPIFTALLWMATPSAQGIHMAQAIPPGIFSIGR